MRICKVWDAEYPWDVRANKMCRTLTDAGHHVDLVARNRDARPTYEELPECTVHRLSPLPVLGSRISAASMFPAFFNPRLLALAPVTSARSTGVPSNAAGTKSLRRSATASKAS